MGKSVPGGYKSTDIRGVRVGISTEVLCSCLMQARIFSRDDHDWTVTDSPAHIATDNDVLHLQQWKSQLKADVLVQSVETVHDPPSPQPDNNLPLDVIPLDLDNPPNILTVRDTDEDTYLIGEEAITLIDVTHLSDTCVWHYLLTP